MDEKTKALIAIGASVSAHCQPCVSYHVGKAQGLGISEEQILEAIGIGQMVERGAGSAMREFTHELFGKAAPASDCCPAKGRFDTPAGDACCHRG
jgi:AhpD family alkylhydroperoxidase